MNRNILFASIVVLGAGAAVGLVAAASPAGDHGGGGHAVDAPQAMDAPLQSDLRSAASTWEPAAAPRVVGCPYAPSAPVEPASGCCGGAPEAGAACEHDR